MISQNALGAGLCLTSYNSVTGNSFTCCQRPKLELNTDSQFTCGYYTLYDDFEIQKLISTKNYKEMDFFSKIRHKALGSQSVIKKFFTNKAISEQLNRERGKEKEVKETKVKKVNTKSQERVIDIIVQFATLHPATTLVFGICLFLTIVNLFLILRL